MARLETSSAAPFGMSFAETGNRYANVQNNNGIVWKNVSIVDTDGNGARLADVAIGGFGRARRDTRLVLETPRRRGLSLFDWGHPPRRVPRSRDGPMGQGRGRGEGLRTAGGRGDSSSIARGPELVGPSFRRGAFGTLHMQFVPDGRHVTGAQVFPLDVIELDAKGARWGSASPVEDRLADGLVLDAQLGMFDGVDWAPRPHSSGWCGRCCC